MTSRRMDEPQATRVRRKVGKQPMRRAIKRLVSERKETPENLAVQMHEHVRAVDAYLAGEASISLSACLALSTTLGMSPAHVIHDWLEETHPDVLQALESLPMAPLASLAEQRLIREVRKLRCNGDGAELVVLDGAKVIGIVVAPTDAA